MLESKNASIVGGGTIDLDRETVDYVLLPKKRSRLFLKADPVEIEGPLRNPKVKAIPWKSATANLATAGGMVLSPFIFGSLAAGDYLTGHLKRRLRKSPCQKYQKARKMEQGPL